MTTASRIRQLKRAILHEHNKATREVYRDHIKFLERGLKDGK